MNKKILTSINITVRGRELGSRKTTANHAYVFVENLPLLWWIYSTDDGLFTKNTTQFSPLFDSIHYVTFTNPLYDWLHL